MGRFLWICVGGALGTGARYLVSGWTLTWLGAGFPYGTLTVNILGSFLLGMLMHVSTASAWMPPTVRLAATTGAMGGFTTYSTFSYETARYLQGGAWVIALANVSLTLFGCLAASLLGWALAGRFLGT